MDKDSCGVGFVAELSGESSHKTVSVTTLAFACECEYEYGACGRCLRCEANTADRAGIIVALPHQFYKEAVDESEIAFDKRRARKKRRFSIERYKGFSYDINPKESIGYSFATLVPVLFLMHSNCGPHEQIFHPFMEVYSIIFFLPQRKRDFFDLPYL
ncbi:hypothetical protein JHK82_033301 [Glycine max]|nr:hypothetical protein JHK82_033301 [Glycine max]